MAISPDPDPYLAHEALDRTLLFAEMVETNLLQHRYIKDDPMLFTLVSKAVADLNAAYQIIGAKTL